MLSLSSPVTRLTGVGPALASELGRAGIERVVDLFWILPVGWDDLTRPESVAEAVLARSERRRTIVRGRVRSAGLAFVRGRRATRIVIDGDGRELTLFWFFAAHGMLARAKPGSDVIAIGRPAPSRRGQGTFMAHPELVACDGAMPAVLPRYPRAGVGPNQIARLVARALDALEPPELVPAAIRTREGFQSLPELLGELHRPARVPAPERVRACAEQLAWAEAFGRVLARRRRDAAVADRSAEIIPPAPDALARLSRAFGFALTTAQARAVEEIGADLGRQQPMRRLLIGDVGSGKTAVALAAVAQVVAAERRAVLLAPTLVLAEQYRSAAQPLEQALGCRVRLLTAATPAPERRAIESDSRAVLVGTHALLEASFDLGSAALVVVDEQQRFGVAQRRALVHKSGRVPHLLTLTATPIPRTLALALRGELDLSELDELPPDRLPIGTELVPSSAWERVLAAIESALERREGAFLVCPRIGGDDEEEGAGAIERHAELAARFGRGRVALAHGRLPTAELHDAIRRFRAGEASLLVGTTVVEVGIDVPHATLMVVDAAESFGLSQLHQLRGRVGRGSSPSRCLLVHREPTTELARRRLQALVDLNNGADVARRDLELRGAGELDGLRQSGEGELGLLEDFSGATWLERIEADVVALTRDDPALEREPALARFAERAVARATLREQAA